MVESQAAAQAYLEEKKVVKLFERLNTALLYAKPADPISFLEAELKKMQAAKERGEPTVFFTETDLRAMFSTFDPTGRGFITKEQLATALQNLGLTRRLETSLDRIDVATFVQVASKALAEEGTL